MAPGEKNNTGFNIFFYNINTTPGHKIILHMHEVEPVLGFQFTAVNQMHITPCCS